MDNDTMDKLAAAIVRLSQQQQTPVAITPPGGGGGFGLQPQQATWQAGQPQPTGVSIPVTVPLPDGREVSVRIHFGPECIGNLPGLAQACAAMFGQYLQAREPWRRSGWNGGSGYRRRY